MAGSVDFPTDQVRVGPSKVAIAFCLVVVATVAVGILGREPGTRTSASTAWAAPGTPGAARLVLEGLVVVEPSREVAYDRTHDFGSAWVDVDRNGCDTRNDILARDLDAVVVADDGCTVLTGILADPYSGTTIAFDRRDATAVQIDHVVPLHAAWTLGAWTWSSSRRLEFANDPLNLVAVDGPLNREKGDRLADRWRPVGADVQCVYAITTVSVHERHDLGVTRPERRALRKMLDGCP